MRRRVMMMVIMLFMFMVLGNGSAKAVGGGWISGSAPSLSGSSGGGGGGACSGNGNSFLLQCTGFSWVFYRSTGNMETEIQFRPDSASNTNEVSRNVVIDKACSEHSDKSGGFWHFGSNAQGLRNTNGVYGYFGNFAFLNSGNGGISKNTFTYGSNYGEWGHMYTYDYGSMNEYAWAGGSGKFRDQAPYVIPTTNSGLNQTIYKDNVAVYEADKYGTEQEVFEDFKKTYKNINGTDYGYNTFPSGVYAFCSWDYDSEPEYYSSSNARVGEGISHLAMTGIKKAETTKTASKLTVQEGDTVPIVFSHNIYSTEKAENVEWNMERRVMVNGSQRNGFFWDGYNSKYEFLNYSEGEYKGVVNVIDELIPQSGNVKFVAKPDGYVTRDNYQEVKFKDAGSYQFCETMNVAGKKLTTACVEIEVGELPEQPISGPVGYCEDWKPGEYVMSNENEGWTRTVSAVKNSDAGFNSWAVSNGNSESEFYKNTVFAKPNDRIEWKHCYYPGVQKVAETKVTVDYDTCKFTDVLDELKNVLPKWENKYDIVQNNMDDYTGGDSFAIGDSSTAEFNNDYSVETGKSSRAGMTLTEGMLSGSPQWAQVYRDSRSHCCKACECEESPCGCCWDESYTLYEHRQDMNPYSDTAMVKVPYNFENEATVSLSNSGDTVYAGETAKVKSAEVKVKTRQNNVTNGNYATRVNESEVRLIVYTSNSSRGEVSIQPGYSTDICGLLPSTHGNCNVVDYDGKGRSGVLNQNENYETGSTDKMFNNQRYNVYDAPAGEYYCAVVAVYPYRVSGDTDVNGTNNHAPWVNDGDKYSWYVSAPSCNKIAKRPSLQVWGGSLYTTGEIATSVSEKRVVAGYYDFEGSPNGRSAVNTTVFGSWVEQSILAPTASISGLASGASTGKYTSNVQLFGNRSKKQDLGGSFEGGFKNGVSGADFCIRSPLTIPNVGCSITEIAGGYGSVSVNKTDDKSLLISRFTGSNERDYEYENTIAELGETLIGKGRTLVVDYNGVFTIKGNITYEDDYTAAVEIPKLVIHAESINIECGVTRVDAVLIADKEVDTCSDGGDINDSIRSNSLKINGTIITDRLIAGRTFGAANGEASQMPAEIVDYDTSLYIWGSSKANASASGKLTTTYLRELAPRF